MTQVRPLQGSQQQTPARSLRTRFVLAISVLVAIVLVAMSAVLVLFIRGHLQREIERQARAYATLAAAPVTTAYQTHFESGPSEFRRLVRATMELEASLEALAIYDVDGRLLFHSADLVGADMAPSPSRVPLPQNAERLFNTLRGVELDSWREIDPEGGRRYVVVAPHVEEGGRHRHAVVFFISYRGLRSALAYAGWQVALLAGLALALGVAFAFLLSAQSLGPVVRLTRGARQMAEGDLQHRIALHTGDEFEVLGQTLDQMAERLSTTVDDLATSNQRLNRLNEDLQQLDRLKSDLLANVSHELRTPLTAISGYVEAMRDGLLGEITPTQSASLEVVERNIRRLRVMIDQLLSYSRMETGRIRIDLKTFDLEPVVRDVIESLAAIHGIDWNLHVQLPTRLPEVYGDPDRIAQVLENLLSNAVKFSSTGSRIDLAVREVEEGVEIRVKDQGIGIPEGLQERIFERFFQADGNARRKYGGIGLGLAIVREILDLHHCRVDVESRPGEGTTFRFVLPTAPTAGMFSALRHSRGRVALLGGDTALFRRVATHLGNHGYSVVSAAAVEHGFALVEREVPDVIVLDRLLLDGDGFALLERLRAVPDLEPVPVVLVMAHHEKALGEALGVAACLLKPVTPEDVERALEVVLSPSADELLPAKEPLPLILEDDDDSSAGGEPMLVGACAYAGSEGWRM